MATGLLLGIISWLSLLLSFRQLPSLIKRSMLAVPFLCDLTGAGLTFAMLAGISKSLGAVIGAIVCGLLINVTLLFRNLGRR